MRARTARARAAARALFDRVAWCDRPLVGSQGVRAVLTRAVCACARDFGVRALEPNHSSAEPSAVKKMMMDDYAFKDELLRHYHEKGCFPGIGGKPPVETEFVVRPCRARAAAARRPRAPRREGCRRSWLAPVARAHDFGSWARRADVGWSVRASSLAGLGYVSQVPHLRVNLQILMHNLVIMGSFYMISHFYLIFKIGFAIFCLITASNTMGKMMYGHTMESIPFEVRPRARWWDR